MPTIFSVRSPLGAVRLAVPGLARSAVFPLPGRLGSCIYSCRGTCTGHSAVADIASARQTLPCGTPWEIRWDFPAALLAEKVDHSGKPEHRSSRNPARWGAYLP